MRPLVPLLIFNIFKRRITVSETEREVVEKETTLGPSLNEPGMMVQQEHADVFPEIQKHYINIHTPTATSHDYEAEKNEHLDPQVGPTTNTTINTNSTK